MSTLTSHADRLLAGINPSKALSVTLDVGTDNETLLNDHLYVVSSISNALLFTDQTTQGWPSRRVRGAKYDRFIDK